MNKQKKLWLVCIVLLLCVGLLGCGQLGSEKPMQESAATNNSNPGETETETPADTAESATDPTNTTAPESTTDATENETAGATESTTPETTTPANENEPNLNFVQYQALSDEEQEALYNRYFAEDPLAFAAWYQRIAAEHESEIPEIIVTGPVDIGDYVNP